MTTLIPKYDLKNGGSTPTGAVNRPFNEKLSEWISVKDFGAVGDGTTDDTSAIKNAINAAEGGYVYFPLGNYVISSPLDVGTNGYELRLVGASNAFASHTFVNTATYQYSDDFSIACINSYATLGNRFSAIQCNNCSLVGSPDTTVVNPCTTAREISNLCIYASNDALVGLYLATSDCLISNCNIALFKNFGLLIRGGITTTYQKISFVDNGWGLTASGNVTYPNTYYSGCQIMVLSNQIPNDYTTLSGGNRATTQQFRDIYMNTRGWMVQNLGGYLGFQGSGVFGFSFDGFGAYTGSLFYLCQANINGLYIENYSYNGLTTATQDPHCLYSYDSNLQIGTSYMSNMTRTLSKPSLYDSSENLTYGGAVSYLTSSGAGVVNGLVGSRYTTSVTVGVTGGGSATYTVFPNAVPYNVGFNGLITLSLQKASDIATYATAIYAASSHVDGLSVAKIPASTQLQVYGSGAGIYIVTITNVNFTSNGGITFTVTWGSGYGNTESFIVDVGLIGGMTNSVESNIP